MQRMLLQMKGKRIKSNKKVMNVNEVDLDEQFP